MVINIFSDNVAPYRMQWAEELAKAGNEVTFVYTKAKDSQRNDEWLVKSSSLVKMVRLPARVIKNHSITFNVVKYVKKNPADVTIFDGYGFVPNYLAILYMNRKKRPFYVNIDGITIDNKDKKLRKLIKKPVFSKYANFFCGSQLTKNHIISAGIEPNKITVHNFSSIHEKDILCGPLSDADKSIYRKSLKLNDKPTVIAVGRFISVKRFDVLIEAFLKSKMDSQLLLIGEGHLRKCYEDMIKEANSDNIVIIDFIPYNKLIDYYKASDLLVLPSSSETWGLVINEAMCFGLPCITTKNCVAGEAMIKNGVNGFITDDSVGDLSEKITAILSDDKLRNSMAIEALETVKKYTIENMARIHMEKFRAQ